MREGKIGNSRLLKIIHPFDGIGSNLLKVTAILLLLALHQCTTIEYHNPQGGVERMLASKEAECKEPIESRYWTILYGTVPIHFLNTDPESLLDGKSFRIKEKADWIDFLISIIGGFTTSITSKTIVIENCGVGNKEKPLPENKPDATTNPEFKKEGDSQFENQSDKSIIPESKGDEKQESGITINGNSLLDEEPNTKTLPPKKQEKKITQKQKNPRGKQP